MQALGQDRASVQRALRSFYAGTETMRKAGEEFDA
jgi:hypothetical protein